MQLQVVSQKCSSQPDHPEKQLGAAVDLKREKSKLLAGYIVQIAKLLALAGSRCYGLQSSDLTHKSIKYRVTSMHFCAELSFFISFDTTLDPAFSILLDSVS